MNDALVEGTDTLPPRIETVPLGVTDAEPVADPDMLTLPDGVNDPADRRPPETDTEPDGVKAEMRMVAPRVVPDCDTDQVRLVPLSAAEPSTDRRSVVFSVTCECDAILGDIELPLNDAEGRVNDADGEMVFPLNDAEKDDPGTEMETVDGCPLNDADTPDTLPVCDGMDIDVRDPENDPLNDPPPLTPRDCPVPPRRTGPSLSA